MTTGAPPLALADPSDRLAAQCIDNLLPWIPMVVLGPVGIVAKSGQTMLVGLALSIVAGLAYFLLNLYLLHRDGQTYGKRRMQIKILRTDGSRAGLGRLVLLRMALPSVLGAIPLLGVPFVLVNTLAIFTAPRKCLHDHFAGTVVVDVKPREPQGPAEF